jgi:hypothetical protein
MTVRALVAFEANEGTTSQRKTLYPPIVAKWRVIRTVIPRWIDSRYAVSIGVRNVP